MQFNNLGLSDSLLEIIEEQNYDSVYPIQQKAIPAILKGNDILGIASTGSGKTASYILPIVASFKTDLKRKNRHVKVLVLVPTRELAFQVNEVFQIFKHGNSAKIKSLAIYGGVSINPQMKNLQGVDILVATPGRLLDLVDSNAVHLSRIDTLVIDEADKMLNLGFKDEMSKILNLLPQKRQNLLFSATLSADINNISDILLKNPIVIKVESENNNISVINELAYLVAEERKGPLLRYLIKTNDWQQVLVFTSSIYQAKNVANKLRKNGIEAEAIHSKKGQTTRREVLQKFKDKKLRVLVTTDLLSRGIDIEYLPYVINYELPRSPKDYIHRIGRTGRAESKGEAISLLTKDDLHHFKVIQKKKGTWVDLVDTENYYLKGY